MKGFAIIALLLAMVTSAQASWWNDSWAYKKKISLDQVAMQQAGVQPGGDALALIRLHTGNFSFFLDVAEQGKDIRFIAGDDKTPLKFAIEKFDPISEMALIWVRLPANILSDGQSSIWMYYGNQQAVDGQDSAGLFNKETVLRYHFGGQGISDATAYGNHPLEATATESTAGVIADAAQFNGEQSIRIPDSPSIQMSSETGWTISSWIRVDAPQTEAVLFQRGDGALTLVVQGLNLLVKVMDSDSQQLTLTASTPLAESQWHYLTVVEDPASIKLYIDGVESASLPIKSATITGGMTLGADHTGGLGLIGLLDEFVIASRVVSEGDIRFAYKMQGLEGSLLHYGEDISEQDSDEGEVSYITITLQNVSVDGWVVLGCLTVMLMISWLVMIAKGIVLAKVRKENSKFVEAFEKLQVSELDKLNRPDSEDDEDALESPLMASLTGHHEQFQGSSLYRIYHAGIEGINQRMLNTVDEGDRKTVFSSQTIEAIRAGMEAAMVRENQRLNSQMVLLTIAVSGGPFIGLLGTVLGVMITFAAIAAQGEVNVNAIAPGVAAALATTVAGLLVAIPALFGYNYLGSRIKEVSADMFVFVDEFVAKLAERFS